MAIRKLSDEKIMMKIIELKKSSDEDLLKSYFEAIYKRYFKKAFLFCRYYGLKYDDSYDVVQMAFINLYNSAHTFKTDKVFKTWFFTIVHNCVKKKYNQLKKNKYIDLDFFQDSDELMGINIYDKVHEREQARSIINSLPEKYKKVIVLKAYSGMNSGEIAEEIKKSERQVYNVLNKACELIKKSSLEENSLWQCVNPN